MSVFRVAGKTVFITGAAGGIGAATAAALHARGAAVVLADLSQDSVDSVAAQLGTDRALPVAVDVTDTISLSQAINHAIDKTGSLDVVFANAGIGTDPPATIDPEAFERVLEVNLLGVWRTVRAALPYIIAAHGHVLVTSSIYAYFNGTANSPYAMSKAGVEQFGRALHTELSIHGATAGILYPGWVSTPMVRAAFGGNPIVTQMRELVYPSLLGKAISPSAVAERVANGIEKRSPRITVPRRWQAIAGLRGLINPLTDHVVTRNTKLQDLLRQLEASQPAQQ
jgi:NAD(P)-dependent dehydrogenase (short-subunit alcohol dehydrogenase family)